MQVDFYQLAGTPLGDVLASIAGKVLAGGGRLLVVTGDGAQAEAVDGALWEGDDTFLPHGTSSSDDAGADQPVLIATDCAAANGARNVALVDGAWRDAVLAFDRVFHVFDAGSIAAARAAWRGLAAADGVTRNFWSQDEDGRWRKRA